MDNNILNDKNLDELGCIKDIDLFSIVDKEFDKKREISIVSGAIFPSSLIILFISLVACLIVILPRTPIPNKNIFKLLAGYYFVSVSMMMLLIIPIRKRKKSY